MTTQKTAKEIAYLYDLFIVPSWREVFDSIVDDEIKLPEKGRVLEAGCGTGSLAISLAVRLGAALQVVGVDESPEKLAIARGKAEIQRIRQLSFEEGSGEATGQADESFALVIADASLHEPERLNEVFEELARVAKPGATVAVKLTTQGSFDEFFSFFWQALYELDLTELTPQLEALIGARVMTGRAEALAATAGLRKVRSVTRRARFDFPNAAEFFTAPLIENFFLADWLAILPEADTGRVQGKMIELMDDARGTLDFDVSIKATLVIGEK